MKSKRENSDSSSSQKGHLKKNCLASVMPHPSQTGKSEEGEEKSGEQRDLVLFSHSQTPLNLSEWMFTNTCLLYTSPSPRDLSTSRMPSSA